jgi:hypothetical protein
MAEARIYEAEAALTPFYIGSLNDVQNIYPKNVYLLGA